ncbi:MAG: hypothetical protein PUP93_24365 [Rhizonema sp. NSF051]|nr:hypothetical protein [Rhizonema sp. NSF051]
MHFIEGDINHSNENRQIKFHRTVFLQAMALKRKSDVSANDRWLRAQSEKKDGTPRIQYRKMSSHDKASLPSIPESSSNASLKTQKFGEVSPTQDFSRQEPAMRQRSRPLKKPQFPRPQVSTEVFSKKQQRSSFTQKLPKEAAQNNIPTTPLIPTIPASGKIPEWLLRWQGIHLYSSAIAFLLVSTALVVYGWTVYSQQLWSQSYRQLQNLQRQERELKTKNEVLKNKIAQEASQPSAKLVSPTPATMIFMNPAPIDSNPTPPTTKPTETQQQSVNPLGY